MNYKLLLFSLFCFFISSETIANSVHFVMTTQDNAEEISWEISSVEFSDSVFYSGNNFSSNSLVNIEVELPNGCYILTAFDSNGDGWNGSELEIYRYTSILLIGYYSLQNGDTGTYQFNVNTNEDCEVIGCTDHNALNYIYDSTLNDESCVYDCPEGQITTSLTYGVSSNIIIQDEFGDTLFSHFGLGTQDNQPMIGYICMNIGQCYLFQVIPWLDVNINGNQIFVQDPLFISSNGICSQGCTDNTACNYNSSYEVDDGSCCYGICGCIDINAYNYDSSAICEDGSCVYEGCVDELACNYDNEASVDDGSCLLPDGCTDVNAINFDSSTTCNDGSCLYNLQGLVYFDENENGFFDNSDYGLPFQEIIDSFGNVYLTNDEGVFYSFASEETTLFTLSFNDFFPFNTTSNPQSVEDNNTNSNEYLLSFGLSNEEPDFAICLDFYPPGIGYPCNDWVNHNLCFRNMGNVPIDGVLEVEYDTLFQNYQEVTPIDSVIGNNIFMSFENLMPGQMFFYDISFLTPTVDFIGENLTSIGRVYGYYDGEQVAFGESILIQEMTCSYDPNDKQVFPAGYEEPHYILPETELEYLVRFQNTGNSEATNVLVTDTIDENLDLSSFFLVANSHSVITTIKTEERVIEFLFENIMLPDSTENELESHGLISYRLTPSNDLNFETEINNTGFIYFDNNPAIITNTTWNTIYNCNNNLATIDIPNTSFCINSELQFENTQQYIENYLWFVDNENITSDSILATTFDQAEQYIIQLEVNNPICEAVDSIVININPVPEIETSDDIILCDGESAILTVSGSEFIDWNGLGTESELEITPSETTIYSVTTTNEFDCSSSADITVILNPLPTVEITVNDLTILATESQNYQWYFNESLINGAISQTYTVLENGNYSVAITNEYGCTSVSNEITISNVAINEINPETIKLFPNPMENSSWLYFGNKGVNYRIKLFSAEWKIVHDYGNNNTGKLEIFRGDLKSGNYLIEISSTINNSRYFVKLILK